MKFIKFKSLYFSISTSLFTLVLYRRIVPQKFLLKSKMLLIGLAIKNAALAISYASRKPQFIRDAVVGLRSAKKRDRII